MFDSDDDATGPVGSGGGTHDMPMESTNVDDGTSLVSAANTYEWADPKYAGAASHVLNAPMLESIESACSHHDVKPDWLVKLALVAAGLTVELHKTRWHSLLLSLKKLKTTNQNRMLEIHVGRDVGRDANSQQSPIQHQPVRGVGR